MSDFGLFFLKLNFLCQQGLISQQNTIKILIFIFLNLLNQFLVIFWATWHLLFTVIFFYNIFYFFIFFWREKKMWIGELPKNRLWQLHWSCHNLIFDHFILIIIIILFTEKKKWWKNNNVGKTSKWRMN
jgi:hypothetical protein